MLKFMDFYWQPRIKNLRLILTLYQITLAQHENHTGFCSHIWTVPGFWRDLYNGAKLRHADLESGASYSRISCVTQFVKVWTGKVNIQEWGLGIKCTKTLRLTAPALTIFDVCELQSTPDNLNLQGKSKKVRVIGSSWEFEANNRK